MVDDEEGLRRVAKRALEMAGYRVTMAADGVEALDIFLADKSQFSLIISDFTMPRLDGLGLLRAIRSAGETIPFLFTSGLPQEDIVNATLTAGRSRVLGKPWTVAELTKRVREMLDEKGT